MPDQILTLNINSENYNFTVEGRDISRIRVFHPFTAKYSFEYKKDLFSLEGFDCLTNYYIGDKKDIVYYDRFILPAKTIKIQVPSHLILNLKIDTKYGNIFLRDLILEKAKLSSIYGKMKIEESHIDNLNIINSEKSVYINNVSGQYGYINNINGNIYINDNFPNEMTVSTYKGNIYTTCMEEDYSNQLLRLKTAKNTIIQTVNKESKLSKRLTAETTLGKIYSKKI